MELENLTQKRNNFKKQEETQLKNTIKLSPSYDPAHPMSAAQYAALKIKLKQIKNETKWQIMACIMCLFFISMPFWAW